MEKIEKEIKFKVDNFQNLVLKLKEMGAIDKGIALQRTIRFDDENKSLESKGKFLRVRSGFNDVITMKIRKKKIQMSLKGEK